MSSHNICSDLLFHNSGSQLFCVHQISDDEHHKAVHLHIKNIPPPLLPMLSPLLVLFYVPLLPMLSLLLMLFYVPLLLSTPHCCCFSMCLQGRGSHKNQETYRNLSDGEDEAGPP